MHWTKRLYRFCRHHWRLETEDWSSQTILAENGGGWPATNEPRTGDVEAARSGQIGMAETRDNGYVYDKLLKKKAPVALWCLPSGSLPSVAGLSRLLLHASGTLCQRRRRQLSRWRHSVSISRHGSSANRFQISSSDLSSTDCQTALLL